MTSVAALALHLAANIHTLAKHEHAARAFHDVHHAVAAIERLINRPIPPRFLGPCPTMVNAGHDPDCTNHHPHACATRLTAHRKATTLTCPTCQTHHNVDELIRLSESCVAYEPYTSLELLGSRTSDLPGVLEQLNITVPRSTFHYWRKTGRLPVRGYRTTQGTNMSYRQTTTDEPTYWVADVRKLRDKTHDAA